MRNKLAKLTAAAIAGSLVVLSGAAFADGMPRGGSIKDAPMAAPFSWTGFYVGGNLGAHWVDGGTVGVAPANAGTAGFFAALIAAGNVPPRYSSDSGTGAIGGLQAGYNWQSGGFVFGFETDIQGSTANASGSLIVNGGGLGINQGDVNTNVEWLGTLRLRLGALLSPTMLAYVTGGFAYGGLEHSFGLKGAPAVGAPWTFQTFGRESSISTGWTIGGGLEWAVSDRFTLGAEYLYVDLEAGDGFVTSPGPVGNGTCAGGNVNNCAFTVRPSDFDNHIARIKFNYKM